MRVITGIAGGRKLKSPEGEAVRPTTDQVKQAIFNILQFDLEGRRVLDLFGGTGQLGIEALSRGAREAVFTDSSRTSVQLIRENLKRCGLEGKVLQTDALSYLARGEKFDVIFIDPPYDSGLYQAVLERINAVDNLTEGGIIVCDIAICPGSFDPITLGHLNIIRRSAKIFDEVVVCVMLNATKTSPMFTIDERVGMVKRAVTRYPNVRVDTAGMLLAEYARQYENAVIVKGLRAASDFDYEFQMNLINKKINPELETMFLTASEKYTFLSSSVVREMATYGADLTGLVPTELIPDIEEKAKLWRKA